MSITEKFGDKVLDMLLDGIFNCTKNELSAWLARNDGPKNLLIAMENIARLSKKARYTGNMHKVSGFGFNFR